MRLLYINIYNIEQESRKKINDKLGILFHELKRKANSWKVEISQRYKDPDFRPA